MIAGCLDWQDHGLIRSALLKNATEESQTWFGLKLKKRGFEKGKDNKDNRIFKGLRLRPTGWESDL